MTKKINQNLIIRPPVVVVLGHVDSGKTSILDNIRKTHVAEKETGGITQHVGAYEVEFSGKKITFIDTPGHEAFSQMRSRGAKVADIAILVIDGCKGVEPQTKEVISHIKKAGIPPIVAINKTDRPEADPERVKRELIKEDILVEGLGGKVPSVNVSAKTGQGIPELLDLILLVAEIEELKGDLSKPAEGAIIESYLDSQRGPTATLLLKEGFLKVGDIIGTPSTFGKIKILEDFKKTPIQIAYPSMPALIIGFEEVPRVGERIKIFPDIETAQKMVEKKPKITPEVLFFEPGKKVLNLILKTDVLGSIEAISEVLKSLPQDKVKLRILESEVGDINESDVKLARSAKARILGFRVKVSPMIEILAQREKIRIMRFEIIYDLVEELRKQMEKILEPEVTRVDLGKIKTLIIFWTERNRQIVGGKVIEGEIKKGVSIEVFRPASPAKRGEGEENVGKGRLISLQKNKKEVERAIKGEECGILYEGDTKIEVGDILHIYQEERHKGEL